MPSSLSWVYLALAIAGGVVTEVDVADASSQYVPANYREYLLSPNRAAWRTAMELKMDDYKRLHLYEVAKMVPPMAKCPKTNNGNWPLRPPLEPRAGSAGFPRTSRLSPAVPGPRAMQGSVLL